MNKLYEDILKVLNEDTASWCHLMKHDRERIANKIYDGIVQAPKDASLSGHKDKGNLVSKGGKCPECGSELLFDEGCTNLYICRNKKCYYESSEPPNL